MFDIQYVTCKSDGLWFVLNFLVEKFSLTFAAYKCYS